MGDCKENLSKTKKKFGGRRNKNRIGDRDDQDSGENGVQSEIKECIKRKHEFKWNLDCLNPNCNKKQPVKEYEGTLRRIYLLNC